MDFSNNGDGHVVSQITECMGSLGICDGYPSYMMMNSTTASSLEEQHQSSYTVLHFENALIQVVPMQMYYHQPSEAAATLAWNYPPPGLVHPGYAPMQSVSGMSPPVFPSPQQFQQMGHQPLATNQLQHRQASTESSKKKKKSPKNFCKLCKSNQEPSTFYNNHVLRDEKGIVRCPVLRNLVCSTCGATGDNAHTTKYCTLQGKEADVADQSSQPGSSNKEDKKSGEDEARKVKGAGGVYQTTRTAAGGYSLSKF